MTKIKAGQVPLDLGNESLTGESTANIAKRRFESWKVDGNRLHKVSHLPARAATAHPSLRSFPPGSSSTIYLYQRLYAWCTSTCQPSFPQRKLPISHAIRARYLVIDGRSPSLPEDVGRKPLATRAWFFSHRFLGSGFPCKPPSGTTSSWTFQ